MTDGESFSETEETDDEDDHDEDSDEEDDLESDSNSKGASPLPDASDGNKKRKRKLMANEEIQPSKLKRNEFYVQEGRRNFRGIPAVVEDASGASDHGSMNGEKRKENTAARAGESKSGKKKTGKGSNDAKTWSGDRKARRGRIPLKAVRILMEWLCANLHDPYPSTGLSLSLTHIDLYLCISFINLYYIFMSLFLRHYILLLK